MGFTDPHCGPCDQIAPELVRLHRQHNANGLALVMVGRGDAEENRKKAELNGFDFPVALQKSGNSQSSTASSPRR